MGINTIISNTGLNSGWELVGGQRKTFTYTGTNITTITMEKLVGDTWKALFKQELTYDGADQILTVTGVRL